MNTSTTVKIWKKTRRLLRLISAYEDKPMTAILHEMASDRLQETKPEGKPLSEVLFNEDEKVENPLLNVKVNDTPSVDDAPTDGFRR